MYYWGNEIKYGEIDRKVLSMGWNRHARNIVVGRDYLEDLVLDGRLMLQWILMFC
jgi:hypothetical protein